MNLKEIAHIVAGEIASGDNVEIERLAKIEDAEQGDITFFSNPAYSKYLLTTKASAVLISTGINVDEINKRPSPLYVVRVPDAYMAFLTLVDVFYPAPKKISPGIHSTSVIADTALIGKDSSIGPRVVIGEECKIGNNVIIHAGAVLYDYVQVGDNTIIYANTTIREGCRIGAKCIIHAGVVIGSDGFGFAPNSGGVYTKIPQRGIVVIEDDVEIGANTTIDRATIGETRIKKGVKLDNLVQIAHNVVIGENTVIASQTGVSGSTKIGKNCIFAGQIGVVGHITIADKTTVAGQSGVSKPITESGNTYYGYPAKEISKAYRMEGALRQLPDLLTEIRSLRKELDRLNSIINEQQSSK